MERVIAASPGETLLTRPERDGDRAFRFQLFCDSRQPEWEVAPIPANAREALMRMQFDAQTAGYRAQYPWARFDIVERVGRPIGRIVVDRAVDAFHVVDLAIAPVERNRGAGSAILRDVMNEARAAGVPVRLQVASSNDRSVRLYARLGFSAIDATPTHIAMEWRARGA